MLALILATSILAGGANTDHLELRLQPESIENGVPRAFTFSVMNTSDHDVRVPTPAIQCEDSFDGSLWLRLDFAPLNPEPDGAGRGCAGDTMNWPAILERVGKWALLHAGQTVSWKVPRERLYYEDKEPGIYEFWAEYVPPSIDPADREELRKAGIDVPHGKLTTSHIAFRKNP